MDPTEKDYEEYAKKEKEELAKVGLGCMTVTELFAWLDIHNEEECPHEYEDYHGKEDV